MLDPIPGTICCAAVCYTRGPPEMFVQLHTCHWFGSTAVPSSYNMLLLSTAEAAIYICHTCHRPGRGERASPGHRILPRPLPLLCTVRSMPTRTKCHWDPHAEHPPCTLCYVKHQKKASNGKQGFVETPVNSHSYFPLFSTDAF